MIEIATERIVKQGKRYREVTNITGVDSNANLPIKYLETYPRIQKITLSNKNEIRILDGLDGDWAASYSLYIGSIYTEEQFREILNIMYDASQRLRNFRKQEKKLKNVWRGEEIFCI